MRNVLLLSLLLVPLHAHAADVLFVSDGGADANIADALRADGHTVMAVMNDYNEFDQTNPSLTGDLSAYDAVIWSASGEGFGGFHAASTFASLSAYVDGGGRVLVTGVGSVGFPDTNLTNFLGAASGTSFSGSPGVISSEENSVTVGPFDLRGIVPTPYEFRYEGLTGLMAGTTSIMSGVGAFGPPSSQWTIRTLGSGEIAYIANGSGAFVHPAWSATAPGASSAYNNALRNFVAAADGSAGEPGAPRVRVRGPFSIAEGSEGELMLEVTDEEGDEFTVSWDLDGDGTYGERMGEMTATVGGATDGDSVITIGAEAVDSGGRTTRRTRRLHIDNVAPMIVSTPPTTASIMQNLQYAIRVDDPAGDLDTITYELVRGPTSASMVGNVFRFVPTEGDVTPEGTAIDCEVAAMDEDGGRTTQMWRMEVANNYAPTDLALEFPKNDVVLIDRMPRLAVRDGSDLDGDALEYFFELDTVDTFDSPGLIQSGAVAEEPGFTTFRVTRALTDGRYFWRAWLSDGEATTQPQVTSFYVVTPMGEVPDAGSDAMVMRPDGGVTPTDRDCACRVATRTRPSAPTGLVLLGVLGLLAARRRR